MKEKETKRDKFVRLAEARTNKIIDMLQLLGNLLKFQCLLTIHSRMSIKFSMLLMLKLKKRKRSSVRLKVKRALVLR